LIVDTSAVLAILRDEPDGDRYGRALAEAGETMISAATFVESAIVVDANHDPVLSGRFDSLLAVAGVQVEPVTSRQAEIARQAYRDYGKGSGHPAGLNFGDCFAYEVAKEHDCRLLFVGNDFSQTDVESVL